MLRQNIEVTQDKKLVNPAIHVVQGDTGRTVVALVKDATISGTATMAFERSDGATYTTTATVNSDNSVEATFTADMLRVAGTGKATFKVVSSGSQVSTYQLYVLVEPSAGFERPVTPSNNKIYVYVNGSPVEVATATEVATKASQSQVDGISATVNNLVGRIVEDESNIAINAATLRNKMNKVRIDFDGTNFKIGTRTLNYKELYDIHISNPDFGFVVYGDRAYLLSYVQDGAGMKEMRFQSTIATTDSSNLSYTKTSGIYVTSSDGINIASVRVADINSENKSYKATEFTEANKNSDIWYPSNKAVNNVVSELKDDLSQFADVLKKGEIPLFIDWEYGAFNTDGTPQPPSGNKSRVRSKTYIPTDANIKINRSVIPYYTWIAYFNNNTDVNAQEYVSVGATDSPTLNKTYPYCKIVAIDFSGSSWTNPEELSTVNINYVISKPNPSQQKVYYCKKDGSGDFTSLKVAIETASLFKNSVVYVGDGTWDIIDELGTPYVESVSSSKRGLYLKNGIHLIFSSKSVVTCEYNGTRALTKEWLSAFNAGVGGFTLENANIKTKNIRYCVHDERDTDSDSYTNKYINCKMYHDSSYTDGGQNQCLGGGLGLCGYIDIDGCVFENPRVNNSTIMSYHNTAGNGKSCVNVKNSYCKGTNTMRFTWYGVSTEKTIILCTNNSIGSPIGYRAETPSATIENIELIEWNNVVRN